MHNATQEQIAEAFTEWMRRYQEDPQSFLDYQQTLAEEPKTYGEGAAPYFLEILEGVQSK